MKRLVIIILVLLVVVLGGAGGLMMLGIVRNPFQHKAPTAAEEAANTPETGPNGLKIPTEQLILVKVPDLIVPVIIGDTLGRRVSLSVRIVARSNPDRKHIQDGMSEFQNALLQDLVPYFQDYYQHHDTIDIEALRTKIKGHAADIFGDAVADILMVNVFESGAKADHPFISDE